VTLPAGARAVPEFHDLDAVWPSESLEGRRQLMRAESTAIVVQLGAFFVAVHESAFGTKRIYRSRSAMSAFGGKADIARLSAVGLALHRFGRRTIMFTTSDRSGTFALGDRIVKRLGYGAMQLAGPGVFGPPTDHDAALAVLREAVARGVNHIDTSDFYGPHVTNQLIREALHPYPDDLVIVTKIGARRGADGSWIPALSPEDLTQAVHDNLRNLGMDVLDVVNFRSMHGVETGAHGPAEGSLEAPLTVLAELQHKGLVRHIGLSTVTTTQIAEGRRICEIVCVQNQYNLAHRADDALIDDLARDGVPYVPYFPLGGFSPLQSSILSEVAARLDATPMQVALAWLIRRAPNILLIPGTSSVAHLRENLASAKLNLPDDAITALNGIGAPVS
jgi:pyridoxine 4-dehydrogenase